MEDADQEEKAVWAISSVKHVQSIGVMSLALSDKITAPLGLVFHSGSTIVC